MTNNESYILPLNVPTINMQIFETYILSATATPILKLL